MADNFHFDMTGVDLAAALGIAFRGAPGGTATGWAVMALAEDVVTDRRNWKGAPGTQRLVLFWGPPSSTKAATPLPAPLGVDAAVPFVQAWLDNAKVGSEPNHDGSNSMGWRVYNEDWGHVARDPYAFAAIEPVWLMHGK